MTDISIIDQILKKIKIDQGDIYILPKSNMISDDLFYQYLFDEDQNLADKIKHKIRKLEFCASRSLIKYVLKLDKPLKKSKHGNMVFPDPYKGSISHKDGHVILCLTTKTKVSGVGIDIEKIEKVSEKIAPKILTPCEIRNFQNQNNNGELRTIIFSFKEAIFKAINPQCGTFFYFHDAETQTISTQNATIEGKILKKLGGRFNEGYPVKGSYFRTDIDGKEFIITLCLDFDE